MNPPESLRVTDTNSADDSAGSVWGIEGSLLWVILGGLFLSLFTLLVPETKGKSLEQLRALWHGYRISVTLIDSAPAPGVDTPEDAERMRKLFDRV